jgi:hypothetical protein
LDTGWFQEGSASSLHPCQRRDEKEDDRSLPFLSITAWDSMRIPPLRSLPHVKRRDLTGPETAAKGVPDQGPAGTRNWARFLISTGLTIWKETSQVDMK